MDVFNELWSINVSQSLGPDGISTIFIKKCSIFLSPIITYLLSGKFSFCIPIFKKYDK